jgi:hypothetical protein
MAVLATATLKVEAKLETGTYSAKLVEIKEEKEGKFGKYWPFIFEVDRMNDGGEWEDLDEAVELQDQVTSTGRFGPGSKLFKIASAAAGRELEENEPIDTDDLMGKRFVITVEKTKKDDKSYSNIKSYSPWKRAKKETQAEPATSGEAPKAKATRQAPNLDD